MPPYFLVVAAGIFLHVVIARNSTRGADHENDHGDEELQRRTRRRLTSTSAARPVRVCLGQFRSAQFVLHGVQVIGDCLGDIDGPIRRAVLRFNSQTFADQSDQIVKVGNLTTIVETSQGLG